MGWRQIPVRHRVRAIQRDVPRHVAVLSETPGVALDYPGAGRRPGQTPGQIRIIRSRDALVMTLTLDRAIARAASMGESSIPTTGYSTPAAIGIPIVL